MFHKKRENLDPTRPNFVCPIARPNSEQTKLSNF
jgi:hypothetical protein